MERRSEALRAKYKVWLWNEEFRDTLGAEVTGDGWHHHSACGAADSTGAVVVINQEPDKSMIVKTDLRGERPVIVATPGQLDGLSTSGSLQIDPRSTAVVIER